MISAEEISFDYDGNLVLADVGLVAQPGQVVGLIGPNGSGKTTLLRVLYNSLRPRAGLVSIDDTAIATLGPRDIARRFAVVAQESPPEIPVTVADVVLLGRSPLRSAFQRYTVHDYQASAAALQRVGARTLQIGTSPRCPVEKSSVSS